jgi:hypothetical protein
LTVVFRRKEVQKDHAEQAQAAVGKA